MHTLDTSKLPQIFESLQENTDRLTTWECDRLEEWALAYERNPNQRIFTDKESRVLEILEQMYCKV